MADLFDICENPPPRPTFDGATFDEEKDGERLRRQLEAVKDVMSDGAWRTLAEISAATGAPEASASARIRDLKKAKFGGHTVNRRRRAGQENRGIFEYQLLLKKGE